MGHKLCRFQYICWSLVKILENKTSMKTHLKFDKVMAIPTFSYETVSWAINTNEGTKILVSEIKFLRTINGCTRINHLTNDFIRFDLKMRKICRKITEYQSNWKNHFERMNKNRLLRKLLNCKLSRWYQNRRRPVFRWIG